PGGDVPAFRSVAVTDEAAFVLSIASPALLYRKLHTEATWSVVYTNTDSLAFFDSMHFWDNREGIAMGDPLGGCLSVIITRDGGATWSEVSCEDLPPAEEAAFAASNGNIELLGDEVWIASGGVASRIFRSPDRGRTWEVVETPIVQGGAMTGLFSVARCDEANGMGWGGNWEAMDDNAANKIATADGGETWELLTPGAGPGYRSCVQYVPNTECQSIWAVGIPGISRSSDGGSTWTTEPDSNFYTVRFTPDGQTAWLAGRGKVACRPVQH
ncbi:MAG: WD40/YVTN/BNR-like repeat-containing protein, partial [Flavobacteriales bacterium]